MINTDEFLAIVQEDLQKLESDMEDTLSAMQEIKAPKTTSMVRTKNMEEGEYTCYKYAETTHRGQPTTILFLEKDGTEIAKYGPFLEEEASKIENLLLVSLRSTAELVDFAIQHLETKIEQYP